MLESARREVDKRGTQALQRSETALRAAQVFACVCARACLRASMRLKVCVMVYRCMRV